MGIRTQLLVFLDMYTKDLQEAYRKIHGKDFPPGMQSVYNMYKRRIEELAIDEVFRDLFLS